MCLFLPVALGIIALQRSSWRRRVYYQNGQYLVSVRYLGQWHELRDFITPMDAEVQKVLSETGYNLEHCLDFVCRNIRYQPDFGELWRFPCETLRARAGDCEDSTFVFVSLAQNFDPDVWAILGNYQGYGHSWAAKNGFIYETTYSSIRQVADPENYRALVAFNDCEVIETYPGALGKVFEVARDEELKLNLMRATLNV